MKAWQLMNVLSEDDKSLQEKLLGAGYNYDAEVPLELTLELLGKSKEFFLLSPDHILRLESMKYNFHFDIEKRLSAKEAFLLYGGHALSEVVDFGSYNVR